MRRYWIPLLLAAVTAVSFAASGCGGKQNGMLTGKVGTVPEGADSAYADSVARMNIVLARVGDFPITAGDVRAHMIKSTGPNTVDQYIRNPDIVQVALGALVDQIVWADMALKSGYKLTPEEERRMTALKSELLATRYVANVVVPNSRPAKEDVESYYNEHQDLFLAPVRVAVRHILVDDEATADRLRKQADGGADFAALARQYSKDDVTRDLGGALGYVQRGEDVLGVGKDPEFYNVVLSLNPGQTAVVHTAQGWHVVKAEKKEGGNLRPLSEVYDDISGLLQRQTWGESYNRQSDAARREIGVQYMTENFEKFTGIPDNCDRIMHMARQIRDPSGAITLLRRVAVDFPDCKSAPEAQFRIAYTYVVKLKDPEMAKRALSRLKVKYGDSEWAQAGAYLEAHIDDPPETFGAVEEVLAAAKSGK